MEMSEYRSGPYMRDTDDSTWCALGPRTRRHNIQSAFGYLTEVWEEVDTAYLATCGWMFAAEKCLPPESWPEGGLTKCISCVRGLGKEQTP